MSYSLFSPSTVFISSKSTNDVSDPNVPNLGDRDGNCVDLSARTEQTIVFSGSSSWSVFAQDLDSTHESLRQKMLLPPIMMNEIEACNFSHFQGTKLIESITYGMDDTGWNDFDYILPRIKDIGLNNVHHSLQRVENNGRFAPKCIGLISETGIGLRNTSQDRVPIRVPSFPAMISRNSARRVQVHSFENISHIFNSLGNQCILHPISNKSNGISLRVATSILTDCDIYAFRLVELTNTEVFVRAIGVCHMNECNSTTLGDKKGDVSALYVTGFRNRPLYSCSCQTFSCNMTCSHSEYLPTTDFIDKEQLCKQNNGSNFSKKYSWHAVELNVTSKSKNSLWITYFVNGIRAQIVPVVCAKKRQGKHTAEHLICQSCSRDSTKRGLCVHEDKVSELMRRDGGTKTDYQDTNSANHPTSSSNSLHSFRNVIASYKSWRPRSLVPCATEENRLQEMVQQVNGTNEPISDILKLCRECGNQADTSEHKYSETTHDACLLSSIYRVRTITVVDWTCPKCYCMNCFDGNDYSLFSVSKKLIFSRDILDFWLFLVAGQALPFRKAYHALLYLIWQKSQSSSHSTKPEWNTDSIAVDEDSQYELTKGNTFSLLLHIINRRSCNDMLTDFIATIRPPFGYAISRLFQCSSCEISSSADQSNSKYIRAIVLDGTATGILGDLPAFVRDPTRVLTSVTSTISNQYMFHRARDRRHLKRLSQALRKAKTCAISPHFSAEEETFLLRFLGERLSEDEILIGGNKISSAIALLRTWFEYEIENTQAGTQITGQATKDNLNSIEPDINSGWMQEELSKSTKLTENKSIPDGSAECCSLNTTSKSDTQKSKIRLVRDYEGWQLPVSRFIASYMIESLPGTILSQPESLSVHFKLSTVLLHLSSPNSCRHFNSSCRTGTYINDYTPCEDCLKDLKNFLPAMTRYSPSLSPLLVEILHEFENIIYTPTAIDRDTFFNSFFIRMSHLLYHLSNFIVQVIQVTELYEKKYRKLQSSITRQFELSIVRDIPILTVDTLTDVNDQTELEIRRMMLTGEIYPGRPEVRPRVIFRTKDEEKTASLDDNCAKYYQAAQAHSPGLFTVQCACNNPKIIGVTIMQKNESVATALSTILSRFLPLPDVVYYDNACNLLKSLMLRCPWLLKKTKLCCDRFHYKSHTACGPSFDPDSYDHLKKDKTSSAESLNAQWATSRTHVRFLSGSNIVPFIFVRSMFLNIKAHIREQYQTQDIDDIYLPDFVRIFFPCSCNGCLRDK